MSSFNINDYKIPVVSGINDAPLPPNFNGNGKGCNGAYYVERFNKLADLFITYRELLTINSFTLNGSTSPILTEVGKNISTPLTFEYSITSPLDSNVIVANLYYTLDKNSFALQAQDISSGYEHNLSSGLLSSDQETTLYWLITFTIDDIFKISTDYIETTWVKPFIAGSSTSNAISTNTDSLFTEVAPRVLDNSGSFTVTELAQLSYIYLFSPREIEGIQMIDSGIRIPTIETPNVVVTTDSSISPFSDYYLYRTLEQTKGGLTFEIIP